MYSPIILLYIAKFFSNSLQSHIKLEKYCVSNANISLGNMPRSGPGVL